MASTGSNPCEMLADVYKQLINMIIGMFVDQGGRLFAGSTIEGVDKQVEEACRCLNLSDDVLRNVMAALKQGMNQGVQKGTRGFLFWPPTLQCE
nr:unnamed protein product [Haemonchus contortus]